MTIPNLNERPEALLELKAGDTVTVDGIPFYLMFDFDGDAYLTSCDSKVEEYNIAWNYNNNVQYSSMIQHVRGVHYINENFINCAAHPIDHLVDLIRNHEYHIG